MPGVVVGGAVVVGAVGTVVAHRAARVHTWLPYVPAGVTVAGLVAVTGGSHSPYRSLLLVLVVGAATLPRRRDMMAALLVTGAVVASPLLYEPWAGPNRLADLLMVGAWILAAAIVARVAAQLRVTADQVDQRTRLVSAVLSSLPQQAAVVDRAGTIVLTNQAWDRSHALGGQPPGTFTPGAAYRDACRHRDGATTRGPTDLVGDLGLVLSGQAPTAVSSLSWELLVGEHRHFTVRTAALPEGLGAVVTHEDITPLVEADRLRQAQLDGNGRQSHAHAALLHAFSHDLRIPLTVITGALNTLQRREPDLNDAQLAPLIDGLTTHTRRLERLLAGALLVTGEAAGHDPAPAIQPRPTCLRQALVAALDRVGVDPQRVTLDTSDDLEVGVDPTLLELICDQLLDDLARRTPADATIDITGRLALGGQIRLEITTVAHHDPTPTAAGDQADGDEPHAGTSLLIVREAARLHGGDAWMEAAPPAGQRVVVELETARR